jgi:hypothetical protein
VRKERLNENELSRKDGELMTNGLYGGVGIGCGSSFNVSGKPLKKNINEHSKSPEKTKAGRSPKWKGGGSVSG